MRTIVVCIFQDPEFFPPTLYAINSLSKIYDQIHIVGRKYKDQSWNYPENVCLHYCHDKIDQRSLNKVNSIKKIFFFLKFWLLVRSLVRVHKPEYLLCYDDVALLAGYLVQKTVKTKTKFWYHSHDVLENEKKFSIGWMAKKIQKRAFKKLNIFSLPSLERKAYFPLEVFKGNLYFMPNYPPKSLWCKKENMNQEIVEEFKLIYQGTLTKGHGFEEIIKMLSNPVLGKKLFLTLVGPINDKYRDALISLAKSNRVSDQLSIMKPVSFENLGNITSKHHVGLAIHEPKDIIYSTGGTSSNKIYEYMAYGLPVILYDTDHYKKHLQKYPWAFFTNLLDSNLIDILKEILINYETICESAINSHNKTCNFETYFEKIVSRECYDN